MLSIPMSMYPLFRTSYVSSSSSPSFSWSSFRNKLRQQRQQRRYVSSHTSVFGENDRVLLRHVALPDKTYLSQPLEPGKSLNSHFGFISHSDIIGRRTRDVVATNKGTEFRLTWPTVTTNLNPPFFLFFVLPSFSDAHSLTRRLFMQSWMNTLPEYGGW